MLALLHFISLRLFYQAYEWFWVHRLLLFNKLPQSHLFDIWEVGKWHKSKITQSKIKTLTKERSKASGIYSKFFDVELSIPACFYYWFGLPKPKFS